MVKKSDYWETEFSEEEEEPEKPVTFKNLTDNTRISGKAWKDLK